MNDHERLSLAKRQMEAIKGFYIHLAVFSLVMTLLLFINAATDSGWWVQWPFLGWGIGVLAHAAAVFGRSPRLVAGWEQRKIAELKLRLEKADTTAAAVPMAPDPATANRSDIDRAAR